MTPPINPDTSAPRPFLAALAWCGGCTALVVAGMLAAQHGEVLREMRERTLPAALQLPALQRERDMVQTQADVADVAAALRADSADEWIRVAILPDAPDVSPVVEALEIAAEEGIRTKNIVRMDAIDVGEPATAENGTVVTPLTLRFIATREGADALLAFVGASGLLSISDVLSPGDRALLLQLAEGENPASIASLEEYLSTDLLRASFDAEGTDRRLLQAFTSPLMERALGNIARESRLASIRRTLGGNVGKQLQERGLWPLRLLAVREWEETVRADGTLDVAVTVEAWSRARE
jgi:hypothetical protein